MTEYERGTRSVARLDEQLVAKKADGRADGKVAWSEHVAVAWRAAAMVYMKDALWVRARADMRAPPLAGTMDRQRGSRSARC
jgi:hypothetical protein